MCVTLELSTGQNVSLSEVGFEPTPSERTATLTQRLRPLGHPDMDTVGRELTKIKTIYSWAGRMEMQTILNSHWQTSCSSEVGSGMAEGHSGGLLVQDQGQDQGQVY